MKVAAIADARSRQEELGQFLTSAPVADFMAAMFGRLPKTVRLLDAGADSLIARLYAATTSLKRTP